MLLRQIYIINSRLKESLIDNDSLEKLENVKKVNWNEIEFKRVKPYGQKDNKVI